MARKCAACGAETSIQALSAIGRGRSAQDPSQTLELCSDCLERREEARWAPGASDTPELRDALEDREDPIEGRYSYLFDDDGGVRLTRLRTDWLDRKTAEA